MFTARGLFCRLGVVWSDGDGFNAAKLRGGVDGGATSCRTMRSFSYAMGEEPNSPVVSLVVGDFKSSRSLTEFFNGEEDKNTAAGVFICVGDLPIGEDPKRRLVSLRTRYSSGRVRVVAGDSGEGDLASGSSPCLGPGDIDRLAAMEARESFCLSCLAIFSKSSLRKGVLGCCLFEGSSVCGDSIIDVLVVSRRAIRGRMKV